MRFLTPTEATERVRITLFGSILLWLGTWLAWKTHADTALLQWIDARAILGTLHPAFEWYSDWGLFIFYVHFIAMLVHGMARRRPLFKLVGIAYLYAQIFGTLLLTYLIKTGCGRPRPHIVLTHDVFCPGPSFAHAFHSFPSSHSINVAIGAIFVLLLLRSRVAAVLALGATLFMALARIALGQHYLSDVLAGLALGAATAGIVMHVYLLPRWREHEAMPPQ